MVKFSFTYCLTCSAFLRGAYSASFLPGTTSFKIVLSPASSLDLAESPPGIKFIDSQTSTTMAMHDSTSTTLVPSTLTTISPSTASTKITTTTTQDPNSDLDEPNSNFTSVNDPPPQVIAQVPNNNNKDDNVANNRSKPLGENFNHQATAQRSASYEMTIFYFSVFIVYISMGKIIYHNVGIIKRNMTEPGILMIFGIVWELVSRHLSATSYDSNPRFNSRFFFYLFLPSTVLESSALLSNKWLFLNLLPILVHSIFGTLLYASSLGFTVYSLSRQNIFNMGLKYPTSASILKNAPIINKQASARSHNVSSSLQTNFSEAVYRQWFDYEQVNQDQQTHFNQDEQYSYSMYDKSYSTSSSSLEFNNLTLPDCLVFGTILSSIDSTTMLDVFRLFQVNERLYYFVLGENLMNNAVVLIILNLLLEFFNASRLTAVKIYIAIIHFFITLIGSIFIGFVSAGFTLVLVRLIKRFQVPSALVNYQNQCQAMVETLLILKLAYLTYNFANITGTSSIISLATFGILQDQYIIHNLNLRSQLTYRQVILATKTMAFSLVYPLLGMLIVEVATASQLFQSWLAVDSSTTPSLPTLLNSSSINRAGSIASQPEQLTNKQFSDGRNAAVKVFSAASVAASKLSQIANHANLHWNFKFLSFVTLITVAYRFVWVFTLTLLCNLFTGSQLKIKFKEQILVAFGSLKGPLAFAIVHRLIEQDDYRDRTVKNKHFLIYTILFVTFISTILKGPFIKPLVSRIQSLLILSATSSTRGSSVLLKNRLQDEIQNGTNQPSSIVFNEINSKLTEYVSNGLNSVIGHTKSPYVRFIELNESYIKPWLTRSSCNTNWLSVFYDRLILDETLNDTCFWRSIGVIDLGNQFEAQHSQELDDGYQIRLKLRYPKKTNEKLDNNQVRKDQTLQRKVRRRSNSQLDTIEENKPINLKQPISEVTTHRDNKSRRVDDSVIPRLPPSGQTGSSTLHVLSDDKSGLKEFVMFNLKLQEAEKRKNSLSYTSKAKESLLAPLGSSSEISNYVRSLEDVLKKEKPSKKTMNLLSSSESGGAIGTKETSSFEHNLPREFGRARLIEQGYRLAEETRIKSSADSIISHRNPKLTLHHQQRHLRKRRKQPHHQPPRATLRTQESLLFDSLVQSNHEPGQAVSRVGLLKTDEKPIQILKRTTENQDLDRRLNVLKQKTSKIGTAHDSLVQDKKHAKHNEKSQMQRKR